MGPIRQFEDLLVWQKARHLTKEIYGVTSQSGFSKDFGLSGQIQRAAVSIMSNIAEGYERGSPGDYARFLSIAKASCGEVRSQLYVALDVGYINESAFQHLSALSQEISRMLSALIKNVREAE